MDAAESLFWSHVDKTENCWVWTGCTNQGYGQVSFKGGRWRAHRLAYTLIRGGIPEGLHLDHLCRNRGCVNPEHLEPVTNRVNIHRGFMATLDYNPETHCRRGHERIRENTLTRRDGHRTCRRCVEVIRDEKQSACPVCGRVYKNHLMSKHTRPSHGLSWTELKQRESLLQSLAVQ